MNNVYLYRFNSSVQGTFGICVLNNLFWNSLELPDRQNKPNISCIPIGSYVVTLRYSPHFKRELYHVLNVPGRSFILIHPANFAGDVVQGWQSHLQGCMTLGLKTGRAKNRFGNYQDCVFNSSLAVSEFMDYLGGKDFKLNIMEA